MGSIKIRKENDVSTFLCINNRVFYFSLIYCEPFAKIKIFFDIIFIDYPFCLFLI